MNKPTQRRKLETRAKLLAATQAIISSSGYSAMRVEEVIQRAGVAKGTFFSHFQNKDSLMELIISAEIEKYLDEIEERSTIQDVDDLVNRLLPLLQFMTSERYIFDLFLRHSGAAAAEEIGPIAQTLDRQIGVLVRCLPDDGFRKDVPKILLAEGIQAFIVQAMALKLCAIQSHQPLPERLKIYLEAWLQPQAVP